MKNTIQKCFCLDKKHDEDCKEYRNNINGSSFVMKTFFKKPIRFLAGPFLGGGMRVIRERANRLGTCLKSGWWW